MIMMTRVGFDVQKFDVPSKNLCSKLITNFVMIKFEPLKVFLWLNDDVFTNLRNLHHNSTGTLVLSEQEREIINKENIHHCQKLLYHIDWDDDHSIFPLKRNKLDVFKHAHSPYAWRVLKLFSKILNEIRI